jgi:hypothetical protein
MLRCIDVAMYRKPCIDLTQYAEPIGFAVPAYVVYQKNKGQGNDCFLTFFRPIISKKFFKCFFRDIRLKIHKCTKFH